VKRYGLPRITVHGIRLGHSTIAIPLGIYSHVSPTLHDEAGQAVADMMLPLTS